MHKNFRSLIFLLLIVLALFASCLWLWFEFKGGLSESGSRVPSDLKDNSVKADIFGSYKEVKLREGSFNFLIPKNWYIRQQTLAMGKSGKQEIVQIMNREFIDRALSDDEKREGYFCLDFRQDNSNSCQKNLEANKESSFKSEGILTKSGNIVLLYFGKDTKFQGMLSSCVVGENNVFAITATFNCVQSDSEYLGVNGDLSFSESEEVMLTKEALRTLQY